MVHFPPKGHDQFTATERYTFQYTKKEWLCSVITGNMDRIGWRDFKPESTCELADSPREICVAANSTLKKPFNQMKSETNIGIKGYRNAEVNGMEHNPCKNVEVLGNKGPSRSYIIKCEMCSW